MKRRNVWLLIGLLYTAIGLLLTSYRYLDDLARHEAGTLATRVIEEMTGVYGALAVLPVAVWVARRFPIGRCTWKTAIPAVVAGALVYSVAHTTLMWISRSIIFPLVGLGPYDYGVMWYRYPMEASNDLVSFATILGFVYFFDRLAAARRAEVEAARLQTQLAQAQLENLRLQLNPHFLFNTLNAISSVMYEDVARADAMLAKLSDFLRSVLTGSITHEIPLPEELRLEQMYVDIMKTRLERSLDLRIHVDGDAEAALVPFMLLQPLLENSIRHGTDLSRGALALEIAVRRRNGSTVIDVTDDGRGFSRTRAGGLGLHNVTARLAHLYGDDAAFTIARRDEGGTRATLTFPFRTEAGT